MNKENKTTFTNRTLYLLVLAVAAVAVITAILISAANGNATNTLEDKTGMSGSSVSARNSAYDSAGKSSGKNSGAVAVDPTSDSTEKPLDGDNGGDSQPVATEIYFVMPVENGTCIKDYTEASVVYNKTLGIYTGHMGMDITGEEGAKVLAAYDGEILAIESDYLNGTTVTVLHENGLKTIYNSIEADENLSVGDKVAKGEAIGVISVNNRREYKDGAHLHFEVEENGVKVAPSKYFAGYDK
ncbi:MAG: M23 family metallopeptidase [Clostridia bacterium]|nr:M23 family metallopeptidase [Clostridia bacterium]